MTRFFLAVLARDLQLAARRRVESLLPVAFFGIALALFPLGVGPEPQTLRQIAPGTVWVVALLASLLSVNSLYAGDQADGSLDQLLLAPQPAAVLAAAKAGAHWIVSALPLVALAPLVGLLYGLPGPTLGMLVASLLLGTPTLSLLVGLGAALTLGLRSGGMLLMLIILPLATPALIFGAGAVAAVDAGLSAAGHVSLLAALLIATATLAPLATAAALRFSERMIATMPFTLTTFASPPRFYALAGGLAPWCGVAAALLAAAGLYIGFFVAPTDATQGEAYRIIFIHVPAAWMSMLLYLVLAFWAAIGWAFRVRLAAMVARAIAPTGAMFTFLALWTGALWGRPTWGTWWVWDARLTSELLLLFLYLGYIALVEAIDDPRRADLAGALVALVGAVNVPVIYFSVRWWNTLHQGATITLSSAPKMASTMLTAMLLMTLAFWAYAFAVVFTRTRALLLERERDSGWVSALRGRTMNWDGGERFLAFWRMGGYGLYVWGSYAVTAALMAADALLAARRRRRALTAEDEDEIP